MKILVVGCLHGHETFGLKVSNYLKSFPLKDIDTIIGNPKALAANIRYVDSDLNRSFGSGNGYEKERAKEMLRLSKRYDYLIDIHTTTTDIKLVPIVTSLGKKNKKIINLINTPEVVYMPEKLASTSLVGKFGDGAVSLELGLKYSKSPSALRNVIKLIKNLADDVKEPPKDRIIYYISRTIPAKFNNSHEYKNYEYIDSLKGYTFLAGEQSYKDFKGFVADKTKKLII